MKNVLIINGDLYKSSSTEFLMEAYERGVTDGGGVTKRIVIADLLFNSNIQFPNRSSSMLETDLQNALREMEWATHIVLFCPVFQTYIPSKVSGFFDRLLGNVFHFSTGNSFYGRTGRIVSILDSKLFKEYQETKKTNFMSIKKSVFERSHISPVYTSTIGHLYQLDNPYSEKWFKKLYHFGLKCI